MSTQRWLIILSLGLVCPTACHGGVVSPATPQLIGAYPQDPDAIVWPTSPQVVYRAYIELEVSNPTTVAERAARLATDYGGYLVSSQTWSESGRKQASLTLAVPVAYFDSLRAALLDLGTLVQEDLTGTPVRYSPGGNEWNTYTSITLRLRPPTGLAFDLGRAVGQWLDWAGGVLLDVGAVGLRLLVIGLPLFLMLIGLITVLRWLRRLGRR